jgi:hypothetical protein
MFVGLLYISIIRKQDISNLSSIKRNTSAEEEIEKEVV